MIIMVKVNNAIFYITSNHHKIDFLDKFKLKGNQYN